jgi:hypothetical protein
MSRPDYLGFLVAAFLVACMVLGGIWMVMFSLDLIHQLMRVCR